MRDDPQVAHVLDRLGERVRALRLQRKLTQPAAAKLALIDQNHWRSIEHARTNPTVATLAGIARALAVTLRELLEEQAGDDSPSPPPPPVKAARSNR